jgi:hypothetical protein
VTVVLHGLFGWWQYVADQKQNGSDPTFWVPDGYVIYFGEWTFQNWQSEFLSPDRPHGLAPRACPLRVLGPRRCPNPSLASPRREGAQMGQHS